MATKTKRMHVAVEFGGVSLSGDGGARIGVKISREDMTLAQADAYLCGKRLSGKVTVTSGDDPNQATLVDDLREEIVATFDVKRISVSPSNISTSLTFVLDDDQAVTLAHFAKKHGRLLIEGVDVLDEDEEVDGNAEAEE